MNDLWGPGTGDRKTDFFKDNVIWNDKEFDELDAITLKSFTFSNSTNYQKYSDAKYFLQGLKDAAKQRYNNGSVSYNKMNDIINDLDYLVYNMNSQFENLSNYEKTWNSVYKKMADESATQVRTNYDKLKFTLQK